MDSESELAGAEVEEGEVEVVESHQEGDEEVEHADAAEAAVRQAEAEGLTLQPSDNAAGYHCVRKVDGSRPFQATVRRAGEKVHLGSFTTAEGAALAYARTPEAQAEMANAKPAPLTAEEALAQAAAEGLELESSSNCAAGYKGVRLDRSRYHARARRAGNLVYLGSFATAEEVALAVARADARNDAPAASPRPAAKRATLPPLTAEEVVAQAAAEGLTLERSSSAAGYKGVKLDHSRYQARVQRAGKEVNLGYFATAQEAALAYARTPEAQAEVANAKAAPLRADKAVAQAAAEGLTLERSNCTAGYRGVRLDGSRYQARVKRAGEDVHLGSFATAEEAALAVARADARNDPPAASPAAAKRAAPPPKPPPAK